MPKPLKRVASAIKEAKWVGSIGSATFGAGVGAITFFGYTTAAAFNGLWTGSAAVLTNSAGVIIGTSFLPVIGAGVVVAGGAAVAGCGVYALFRGVWGRSRKLYAKQGLPLQSSDLVSPYWSCYFSSVVIIGIRDTGKTELKNYFRSHKAIQLSWTRGVEIHLAEFAGRKAGRVRY